MKLGCRLRGQGRTYSALKSIVLEAFIRKNYRVGLDTFELHGGFPAWLGLAFGVIGAVFIVRLGFNVCFCRWNRTFVGLPLFCDLRTRGILVISRMMQLFTIYM